MLAAGVNAETVAPRSWHGVSWQQPSPPQANVQITISEIPWRLSSVDMLGLQSFKQIRGVSVGLDEAAVDPNRRQQVGRQLPSSPPAYGEDHARQNLVAAFRCAPISGHSVIKRSNLEGSPRVSSQQHSTRVASGGYSGNGKAPHQASAKNTLAEIPRHPSRVRKFGFQRFQSVMSSEERNFVKRQYAKCRTCI